MNNEKWYKSYPVLSAIGILMGFSLLYAIDVNGNDEKTNVSVRGSNTIVLDTDNVLTIRTPFSDEFMQEVFASITEHAHPKLQTKPLYVYLYTPGGRVTSGQTLIDGLNGLKRPVHTITDFAASMGFQTVQGLKTRYILPSGTLMSHRMSGGAEGEFGGNLNTRLDHASRMGARMDTIAAKRMGISLEDYQKLIGPEYWRDGEDAIADKAADKITHVVCTKRLIETKQRINVKTMFGDVDIVWSACPLLRTPKVEFPGANTMDNKKNHALYLSETQKQRIITEFTEMLTNPEKTYRQNIKTGVPLNMFQ